MHILVHFVLLFSVYQCVTGDPIVEHNRRLVLETYRYVFNVTLDRCNHECLTRPGCESFNYLTRMGLCELNMIDANSNHKWVDAPGYVHASMTSQEKPLWAQQCEQTCSQTEVCQRTEGITKCIVHECPKPPIVGVAHYQGNLRHVGARIRYECPASHKIDPQIQNLVVISECLTNGTWSSVTIGCVAIIPICLDGWQTVGFYCFKMGTNAVPFSEAKEYCDKNAGHIVYVQTTAESKLVWATIKSKNVDGCVYIGITYSAEEQHWHRYEDAPDKPIEYNNWAETPMTDSKRCATLRQLNDYSQWFATSCERHCFPLCKEYGPIN